MTCPSLTDEGHVTVNTSSNLLGDHVHLTCDEGYKLTNGDAENVVTCLETGNWSSDYECISK